MAKQRDIALTPSNKMEVALLLSDLKQAQKIADVFRQVGVIPYIYEDLLAFWDGVLESIPILSVVDVALMNTETRMLKNHPYVRSEELNLCFFYRPSDKPLLMSTYDIFNFGLIEESDYYQGPIKSILARVNKHLDFAFYGHQREVKNTQLTRQMEAAAEALEGEREARSYRQMLDGLCEQFSQHRNADDFYTVCEEVFSAWEGCQEFAYLELTPNSTKLISPPSESPKARMLPSIWPGQACPRGIEYFAQAMASQVTMELMGVDVVALQIFGRFASPDKLIYLRPAHQDMLRYFAWDRLEKFLSGIYCYYCLRDLSPASLSGLTNVFDFMASVDRNLYGHEVLDEVFDIDFSKLVSTAMQSKRQFHWDHFFRDLLSRLEHLVRGRGQVAPLSLRHVGIVMPRQTGDDFFLTLQGVMRRFPLWRYFVDSDAFLAEDLAPIVTQSPASAKAYLMKLDKQDLQRFQQKAENLAYMMPKRGAPTLEL